MKTITIAIDGYSSCGKSTFAKAIAAKLGYVFIDTGAMYRAVTLYAINNKLIVHNTIDKNALIESLNSINIEFKYNSEKQRSEIYLDSQNVDDKIRGIEVSSQVSHVSQIKEVRQFLVAIQQKMGEDKGVVMDGRDIGTVVMPSAELKIFMTALPEIRAQRRFDELKGSANETSLKQIEYNLLERDHIDENRSESPLRRAADAVILDNSEMTPAQQMEWFENHVISLLQ